MAKSIYKNFETKPEIQVYELSLAKDFAPQEEAIEIEDTGTSYTGPTVDDLKLEAEAFKKKFEIEIKRKAQTFGFMRSTHAFIHFYIINHQIFPCRFIVD